MTQESISKEVEILVHNTKVFAMIIMLATKKSPLGGIPEVHLYARVMGGMDLDTFEMCINALVDTKLVRRDPSHLLVWIGPDMPLDDDTKPLAASEPTTGSEQTSLNA